MVLGLAGPEELADAGDAALEDGLDSPALIALTGADTGEARALFEQALTSLSPSSSRAHLVAPKVSLSPHPAMLSAASSQDGSLIPNSSPVGSPKLTGLSPV